MSRTGFDGDRVLDVRHEQTEGFSFDGAVAAAREALTAARGEA
jgi:hypothetical protein